MPSASRPRFIPVSFSTDTAFSNSKILHLFCKTFRKRCRLFLKSLPFKFPYSFSNWITEENACFLLLCTRNRYHVLRRLSTHNSYQSVRTRLPIVLLGFQVSNVSYFCLWALESYAYLHILLHLSLLFLTYFKYLTHNYEVKWLFLNYSFKWHYKDKYRNIQQRH